MSARSVAERPKLTPLSRGQTRELERLLDRIDTRLRDAPAGMHAVGPPGEALVALGLPPAAAAVWARFDGLELAAGEARLHPLAAIVDASAAALSEGLARSGDQIIGERGRELVALPPDPWAEGAEVVALTEDGERHPEAASVAHLILGWLGEMAVLYDDDGEFRDDLFGDDGELTPAAERRLLRRRLDIDPDAARARVGLGVGLRRAGELRAARAELAAALHRAPEYADAHHELGRVLAELGLGKQACAEQQAAARCADDPAAQAYFLAWAIEAAPESERDDLRAQVLATRPEFAVRQLQGARARIEREQWVEAGELCRLGLAVAPRNAELLAVMGTLRKHAPTVEAEPRPGR